MHHTTPSLSRPSALFAGFLACLFTLACDARSEEKTGDKTAEGGDKTAERKPESKVEPKADEETYEAYLGGALDELAAAGRVTSTAERKSYGCSVKYADDGGGVEVSAKVGEPAPAFTLANLAGESVSLSDFAGKTVVLEWFNPDCPFVVYAHGDGPLAGLANERVKGGVVWLAINSGAEGKQGFGAERNTEAKADWKLEHPILLDPDGKVGHTYGAKTTPQMFVIDGEGKLVYAGALDNAPLGRVGS